MGAIREVAPCVLNGQAGLTLKRTKVAAKPHKNIGAGSSKSEFNSSLSEELRCKNKINWSLKERETDRNRERDRDRDKDRDRDRETQIKNT